ncbi:MAG: hypothetical protein HQ546_08705 [Planctomycetes bacterium]|nr:hypothetical protein [Planctomycetota bacterium]
MMAMAGWVNRQQQEVIEYLRQENRILREKLGKKRIILNDSQRRCLATAAIKLGKDLLRQYGTLFSPETLLRWNRMFIASRYDGSDHRGKRGPVPTKANMIRKLVLMMAEENPSWGYGHRAASTMPLEATPRTPSSTWGTSIRPLSHQT